MAREITATEVAGKSLFTHSFQYPAGGRYARSGDTLSVNMGRDANGNTLAYEHVLKEDFTVIDGNFEIDMAKPDIACGCINGPGGVSSKLIYWRARVQGPILRDLLKRIL